MKDLQDILSFWRENYPNSTFAIEYSKSDSYMFITIRQKGSDKLLSCCNGRTYDELYSQLEAYYKHITEERSPELPGLH